MAAHFCVAIEIKNQKHKNEKDIKDITKERQSFQKFLPKPIKKHIAMINLLILIMQQTSLLTPKQLMMMATVGLGLLLSQVAGFARRKKPRFQTISSNHKNIIQSL